MTTIRPIEANNGITTSWLPFTTDGPSVGATCSSAMYMPSGSTQILAFDIWQGVNIPSAPACLPTEATLFWKQSGSTRTSLGPFHCPSDFTTATTSSVNSISTSVYCCPSDYKLTTSGTDTKCLSTLAAGSIVPKIVVGSSWVDTTITAVGTTITGAGVQGYIFASKTSSTSSKKTSTKSTKSTKTGSAVTAAKTAAKKAKKKLKGGAVGGIAAGVAVAVLSLVSILVFFLMNRRKKQKAEGSPEESNEKDVLPDVAESGTADVVKTKGADAPVVTTEVQDEPPKTNIAPQETSTSSREPVK